MASVFLTKKIKEKQTLGEKFRTVRKRRKITLTEAEIGTKVRAKYLAALENGNWDYLPQAVYTRGFVLSYAKFLNLDSKELISLFETEVAVRKGEKPENKISYNQVLDQKKVLVTPKLLGYGALGLFVIALSTYIIIQLSNFAGNPALTIIQPNNNSVYESDNIDLVGLTEDNTVVTVNDEKVPVTSDGKFSLNLKLHRGVNVIKVQAMNKIKKLTSQVYTIEYKPKTASVANPVSGE